MPDLAKIILRNHKIDAVKRFHPWIFSGAIKEMEGEVKEGAIVEVYSRKIPECLSAAATNRFSR
jgi:23S rRNA (cytosine1962-C5)-methyltransferase